MNSFCIVWSSGWLPIVNHIWYMLVMYLCLRFAVLICLLCVHTMRVNTTISAVVFMLFLTRIFGKIAILCTIVFPALVKKYYNRLIYKKCNKTLFLPTDHVLPTW